MILLCPHAPRLRPVAATAVSRFRTRHVEKGRQWLSPIARIGQLFGDTKNRPSGHSTSNDVLRLRRFEPCRRDCLCNIEHRRPGLVIAVDVAAARGASRARAVLTPALAGAGPPSVALVQNSHRWAAQRERRSRGASPARSPEPQVSPAVARAPVTRAMSRPVLAFPVGPARRYREFPGRVRRPSQALQSS
jgi:hypothetical protein